MCLPQESAAISRARVFGADTKPTLCLPLLTVAPSKSALPFWSMHVPPIIFEGIPLIVVPLGLAFFPRPRADDKLLGVEFPSPRLTAM